MSLIADAFFNIRTPKYVVKEMSKKSRFGGAFDKWHGKWVETLLKSKRQQLCHIYWSLWRILQLKRSLWLLCKVWGPFVNPLNPDHKYSLLSRGNLLQDFQMHLSEKPKTFCQFFFFQFGNLESILNIFKRKMTLIADVFLSLRTQKNVVR